MTIFDEIAITYTKVKRVEEKLEYIRYQASTPKSSILSDMPKGGGTVGNPLEEYLIKQEELVEKHKYLEDKLERQWARAVHQMNIAKIDKQSKTMMYYRFKCNMQWKKCAAELDRKYPNCKWNVNKCFRKYRDVLCRIRKV